MVFSIQEATLMQAPSKWRAAYLICHGQLADALF